MTALKIILGIFLFLFLLTLIPLRFEIGFQEEFSLTLRYLFLKFPLFPGKENTEKETSEKAEAEPEKEEQEKGKDSDNLKKLKEIIARRGFWGFVESLLDLVKLALHSTGKILSHMKLKRFDLYLCLGGEEDAAAAAILYGRLSAGVYSACGGLFALMKPRNPGVTVDLDYRSPENRVNFSGTMSIRPCFAIGYGVALLVRAVPRLFRLLDVHFPPRRSARPGETAPVKENGG